MLGLFDSGIGGLSVVHELLQRAPRSSFLYLGDTARAPYGNKSAEAIRRYALEDAHFLIERGATSIAVACNTVSSLAMDILRRAFPNTKFFDVIQPAVDVVMRAKRRARRVGVIGTRATIQSNVYEKTLRSADTDPTHPIEVISVACPLFAPIVEEGWSDRPETKRIVRRSLASLRQKQVDALILGCTHYPWLLPAIRASLHRRVAIINSAKALVSTIEREAPELLQETPLPLQQYFFTDVSAHTKELAHRWLRRSVELSLVRIV